MPPRVVTGRLGGDGPSPSGFFARTFTSGQVAEALFVSRQTLVDLVRRGGLEVGDIDGRWRRHSFIDAVLFRIAARRARHMDAKAAAALANALRPFTETLARVYATVGMDALRELGAVMPTAVAKLGGTPAAPEWRVQTYSSLARLGCGVLELVAKRDEQNAALVAGDMDDPAHAQVHEFDPDVVVHMGSEFNAVAVALSRPGVIALGAGPDDNASGGAA